MKLLIDIPDNEIPKRQEIISIGIHFIGGKVCECTYPFEEITKENEEGKNDRPKGKWIERVEHRGCYLGVKTVYSYTCPFCGVKEYEKHPFCHCGADMRGDEK